MDFFKFLKSGKKKKIKNGITKYEKRLYIIIIFFISLIPILNAGTEFVYAAGGLTDQIKSMYNHGGWAPNGIFDGGIYDTPWTNDLKNDGLVTAVKNWATGLDNVVEGEDMNNYVFNLFTCVIGTIAYSIGKAMESVGIGLSNIIYGRVLGFGAYDLSAFMLGQGYDSNLCKTTFFHFELVAGNVYGYIGAIMYAGFRVLAVVGIVCALLTKLSVALVKPGGESRESFKSALSSSVILMAMLFLMPYFMDLAIYVRNVLLYGIGRFCFEQYGAYDLLDAFLVAYADTNSLNVWVFDLGMLGVVCLTLYFAFQYMSTAMGTMLMFALFPFVCLVSTYDKNAVRSWVKEMIGYLVVPVIDAFLFLIPIIIGRVAETQIILQVVSMGMIIPARQAVRSMLGMSSASGIDRVGAFGAMAAISAAKAVAGTVAKVVGTFASGGIAQVASKAGGAMAGAKKEALTTAEEQMGGTNGFAGSPVTRLPFDMDEGLRAKKQPMLDEYNELLSKGDKEKARKFRAENLSEVEEYLKPKSKAEDREADRKEGSARLDALNGTKEGLTSNLTEISKLMEENRQYNAENSAKRVENAQQHTGMQSGLIGKNEGKRKIADNNVAIAENDQKIRANLDKISALQEENKEYESSVRKFQNYYGKDGIPEDKRNAIEMRYADAMNFDSGVFKSLTDAQKAEFYAQRSVIERQKSLGMGAGAIGGAVLGYGGTMFMDNSAKLGAVTVASSVGGAVGGYIGGLGRTPVLNNQMNYSGGSSNVNVSMSGVVSGVTPTTDADSIITALERYNHSQVASYNGRMFDASSYNNVLQGIYSKYSPSDIKGMSSSDMDAICSRLSRELKSELSVVTDCFNHIRKSAI